MNKKVARTGIVCGILLCTTIIAYAITTLFYSNIVTSNLTKKVVFQFDLSTDVAETVVGPGDSFDVKPMIYNDATEEMYVFIRIDMPTTYDGVLYRFEVQDGWITVDNYGGTIVFAYAGSEMTVLQPGDSTSALAEQMTMNGISNAEYAAIDDINIIITGYAIGTEDVPMNPIEAWNYCKIIGNTQ